MNIPGFTAETSLYKTGGHYRAMAGAPNEPAAAAIKLALDNPTKPPTSDVDCKTFPDSITCHECNSTGPGTFDCCELKRPGELCVIANDPNLPVPLTSRFPRLPSIRKGLLHSVMQGL